MRKTDDEIILSMLNDGKLQKDIAKHFNVSPAAISKRIKRLLPKPETFESLTDKKQRYVLERTKGATKTNAALTAFDCSSRESAKSIGIELDKDPDIQTAMNEVLQNVGLTRHYRARKIKQHVDSPDPHVSLKALDQTNKIDGSYSIEVDINPTIGKKEICRGLRNVFLELINRGWTAPPDIQEHFIDVDFEEIEDDEELKKMMVISEMNKNANTQG